MASKVTLPPKKIIRPEDRKRSPACKSLNTLTNGKSVGKEDVLIFKNKKETKFILRNTASGVSNVAKNFLKMTYDTVIETKKFFKIAVKGTRKFKVRVTRVPVGHFVIWEKMFR